MFMIDAVPNEAACATARACGLQTLLSDTDLSTGREEIHRDQAPGKVRMRFHAMPGDFRTSFRNNICRLFSIGFYC
jgi:hypothetical protein